MGLRSAIQDRKPGESDSSDEQSTHSDMSNTYSHSNQTATTTVDTDRAADYFGMPVPDANTLHRLKSNERMYGKRVHKWVDEGMPTDIMGKTRDMEAFRERQAKRPSEVPTNIERQNNRSVQRSEQAVTETGPAGETGVPDPVRDVISSTGQSLDASIQRAMEDRMGESFSGVQVHTGSTATAACESINARAFTVGNHVAFNSGEYDPSSAEGQHVIAHELAHVRQQTGGAVSMLPQEDMQFEIDPDPQLEREAEETAQRVMQGGELGIQRLEDTEVHLQRIPTTDRDSTSSYLSGNRADGENPTSLIEKAENATADAPSPSVSEADLGSENIAEFQKAVMEDIQTLYQKVEEQGVLSKMSDAGTGEAVKIGMTKAGEYSNIPFGKIVGGLSGAAAQEIYNNREKVLEFLGFKSDSVVDGDSNTGSGNSTGDAKSRRK